MTRKKISELPSGNRIQQDDQLPVVRGGANYRVTAGSAAMFDAADFATAAQGAKADSALQPGSISQYTDEMAQDSVGGILTDSAIIDFTYNDAGNQITATVKDASITRAKLADAALAFTSVNPPAITLDGTTDAALTLQAELDRIAGLGGGTLKLISPLGIYLNAAVQLSSYTVLDLSECPPTYGPNGCLWIVGELAESPTVNKPKLYADITAGATSFDIVVQGANVTPSAGQQFILRGQRDATGAHLGKETGYISSVVHVGTVSGGERWTITPVSPIGSNYSIRYTGDAYELATSNGDYSSFTVATYSAFTGNIAAGAMSATVNDATLFAVGDYLHVSDAETVGDSTGTSDGNPIHNEITRIVAISSNTLTFQKPLYHGYTAAFKGGVSKINPALNAGINRPRAVYGAADGAANAYGFRFKYAVDCWFDFPSLSYLAHGGTNYGPVAQGFRLEYSLNCQILLPSYTGKPDAETYTSAQGYGVVYHGCTDCKVIGTTVKNARHGMLMQYGAAGNEYAVFHDEGSRISAVDFHGINARQNHAHGGTIVGGPLSTPDSTNKVAIKVGNTSHIYGDFNNLVENIAVWNYSYFEGSVGGIGIQLLCQSAGNIVRNILVDGCDYGLKVLYNSTYPTSILGTNTLHNITLRKCTTAPFNIDGGVNSAIANLICEQVISDGNSKHFEFSNVAGMKLIRPQIRNPIASSGRYSVKSTNTTGLKVIAGYFDGANRGVSLNISPAAQVIDTCFHNQLESIVLTDDTSTGNNNGFVWENNSYVGTSGASKTIGTSTGYTITERGASSGFTNAVTGITAAGTNQSGATQLAGNTSLQVVATGTSNQGVRLPSSTAASLVTVVNVSGATIKVYPQSGGQIDAGSVNAAFSIANNGIVNFFGKDLSENWYSEQGVKFSGTALTTLSATGIVGTSNSVARADHSHPVMDVGAGAPATTPADGTFYLDNTNSRLYVRQSGTWKYTALT